MTEKEAWIAFSAFPNIGPARFGLLRKYFGSAKRAFRAPAKKFLEIGFSDRLTQEFENFRKDFDTVSYLLRLRRLGVKMILLEDKDYPEMLKKIEDAPYILYVRNAHSTLPRQARDRSGQSELGKWSDISVAVVGTRKPTAYGREVTERLVTGLVDNGVTVVSGLALGIDAIAHRVALAAGGKTIGVLGCGVDNIYPPANRQLGEKMLESDQGIIVSEYPLGYPALPQNFPTRNRIVSGLSLGVLVIEGAEKSGTLLTASNAASQGREVFAVPGPITSPVSRAPHFLLKNGAKLVEKVEDILEELKIEERVKSDESKRTLPETKEERRIMEILKKDSLDIDSLVRISGLDTGKVLGTLTGMELKGMVKNIGGVYTKL
ncbi:MAG: DNA-protecting protein DprA [Candidatus Blackburnbacteria bacterium]|nr:DNA-protecting protein DprA [Candidatus Blackburnbacteria bacterium]